MAARKKTTIQTELFAARYILKSGPWYRANWAQLRTTVTEDEARGVDPGNSSWIFWTSRAAYAEVLTGPPPGWNWGDLTPAP